MTAFLELEAEIRHSIKSNRRIAMVSGWLQRLVRPLAMLYELLDLARDRQGSQYTNCDAAQERPVMIQVRASGVGQRRAIMLQKITERAISHSENAESKKRASCPKWRLPSRYEQHDPENQTQNAKRNICESFHVLWHLGLTRRSSATAGGSEPCCKV